MPYNRTTHVIRIHHARVPLTLVICFIQIHKYHVHLNNIEVQYNKNNSSTLLYIITSLQRQSGDHYFIYSNTVVTQNDSPSQSTYEINSTFQISKSLEFHIFFLCSVNDFRKRLAKLHQKLYTEHALINLKHQSYMKLNYCNVKNHNFRKLEVKSTTKDKKKKEYQCLLSEGSPTSRRDDFLLCAIERK